jgi:outer membrane protein insertion porin family
MRVRVSLLVALAWSTCSTVSPPLRAQITTLPSRCIAQRDPDEEADRHRVIIQDVSFDGGVSLSESDREELVSSLRQEELYDQTRWIERVEEIARDAWMDQGYFQVEVTPEVQIFSVDSAGEHVFLKLHVNEGPKCWLKEIRFRKGDISESSALAIVKADHENSDRRAATAAFLAFSPEQLRNLIPLDDGDLFRIDRIRKGVQALNKLYGSYGYIEFVATPATEIDEQHRILLAMDLDEGKQYRIGKVQTRGANPTVDSALQSALPSGEVFDNDHWTAALESLSPDFSPEQAEMRKDERAGTVDLIFDFRSCRLAEQLNQR